MKRTGIPEVCVIVRCLLAREPQFESECYAVLLSDGQDCKTCMTNCYRSGWTRFEVVNDNLTLVQLNYSEKLSEEHIAEQKKKQARKVQ